MIPTMVFSIERGGLDFFAGPDESDHQGEEAD
jgi:hypothetical protein